MDSRNLPLRILYTINSSPQYILARSPSSVPIVLVPQVPNSGSTTRGTSSQGCPPCYATTSLKTCLDTICRSSPELVQDVARDFSVYVLDPLESNSAPAPVNISNAAFKSGSCASTSSEPSNGVAVGLGLMSWALVAGESDGVTVAGTLVKQGTAQEALEVIFALRETAAMQKAGLAAALGSWGTLPKSTSRPSDIPNLRSLSQSNLSSIQPTSTIFSVPLPGPISSGDAWPSQGPGANFSGSIAPPSVLQLPAPSTSSVQSTSPNVSAPSVPASLRMHSRRKPPKSKTSIKAASGPPSEADKLMLAEDIYIGPTRKKGRPAKSSSTAEGSEGKGGTSSRTTPADEDVIIIDDTGTRESKIRPTEESALSFVSTSPHPNPNPCVKAQDPMTLLDILAYLSASSSSRDPSVQNAALLAALNAIDSTASSSGSGPDKTSNPVLVNALKDFISAISKPMPPARDREGRPHANDHRRNVSQDDEIVLLDKENVNPAAFRRGETEKKNLDGNFSARLNVYSTPVNVPASPSPTGSGASRKRTLSDFMDDRDCRMNLGRVKGKEGGERRDAHRHVHSATGRTPSVGAPTSGLRHYPRLLCDQGHRCDRTGTNSYYRTGTESWSSPPRSRSEDRDTASVGGKRNAENSRLNPFDISESPPSLRVTASSPVRSQSRARKRYIVPAWARTETSTQPKLSQATQQALEEEEVGKKKKSRHRGGREKKRRVRSATLSSSISQADIVAHLEDSTTAISSLQGFPQPIASSNDCPVFAMASVENPIPAPFSSKTNISVPRTPPKQQTDHVHTAVNGSGSLFTPISSRLVNGSSLTESPLFSPRKLFSPLPSKATKMAASVICHLTNEPLTLSAYADEGGGVEDSKDTEDVLSQELDNAFKEMEQSCGPSSASGSGDTNQDGDFSSTMGGTPSVDPHIEVSSNRADAAVNALWAGLPPSSPPPMSSPLLIPEACSDDQDMDDLDLPVATSDAEDYATDSEVMPPSSAMPDLSTCSDQEFAEYLRNNDFSALLAVMDRSPAAQEAEFDMDVFNQYTTLNAQSDGSYGDQNSDINADAGLMRFQNELAQFDFTEFWETCKPLVQNHALDSSNHIPGADAHPEFVQDGDARTPELMENFDHAKLAEDVQALLSGCLV